MNTIAFPKMFKGNSTVVIQDYDENVDSQYEATLQSLHLLLNSESGTLFGDPEYGIRLKRYMFEQNNYILKDILIDEIYTQIKTFCPQVFIERKNIKINQIKNKLYADIYCKDRKTFKNNTYQLVLFNTNEENI